MAKPPEPLVELLPLAQLVVEAAVESIVSTGPAPPKVDNPDRHKDVGSMAAEQLVVLRIVRVLRGTCASATLTVKKPLAPYAVKVGTTGAWLLQSTEAEPLVLGRYGPDSWHISRVEAALRA
jgi:hypothetical protein